MHAALAQSVEHLTRNEKVVSSILTGGSTQSVGSRRVIAGTKSWAQNVKSPPLGVSNWCRSCTVARFTSALLER